MRASNKSRSRNKSSNGSQGQRRSVGNIINRVFDSAGPDGKVRGTPQQIIDKYNVLARDAQLAGDRVAAESFLQHAEHYSRLLGEAQRQVQEQRQTQDQSRDNSSRRDDNNNNNYNNQNNGNGNNNNNNNHNERRSSGQDSNDGQESDDSGLTTIDTGDYDDASGPVETPESRSERKARITAEAPRPEPQPQARVAEENAPPPAAPVETANAAATPEQGGSDAAPEQAPVAEQQPAAEAAQPETAAEAAPATSTTCSATSEATPAA